MKRSAPNSSLLDALLIRIDRIARRLPAHIAREQNFDRNRLLRDLNAGRRLELRSNPKPFRVPSTIWSDFKKARQMATHIDTSSPYLDRLDELEMELLILEALGNPKVVRPLSARRYGTGASQIELGQTSISLIKIAKRFLDKLQNIHREPSTLPADSKNGPSLAAWIFSLANLIGLEVNVRVEKNLIPNAACGEKTIYLADRKFGMHEARRVAVHEVLGHLVTAANARAQPIALPRVGTASSVADQEGVALYLEEQSGFLDENRVRTLAARVWVTHQLHDGADFNDIVQLLLREHGFLPEEAIALGERSYRGGGVSQDAGYLSGWIRIRHAIQQKKTTLHELQLGRVSLSSLPKVRALLNAGLLRDALYKPSFSRSRLATVFGTNASILPPSLAASLIRLDET